MATRRIPLVPDFYDVLGLAPGASANEIRASYRQQARRHHPDLVGPEADREKMVRLNQAYDVLSKPSRRALYDLLRRVDQQIRPPQLTSPGAARRWRTARGLTITIVVLMVMSMVLGRLDIVVALIGFSMAFLAMTAILMNLLLPSVPADPWGLRDP